MKSEFEYSPYAVLDAATEDQNVPYVETNQTSQYLGDVLNERGNVEQIYALYGIVVYSNDSISDQKSNGGCTITTTIFYAWDSSYFAIKLINSQAYLTGTLRPASLKMENNVFEGYTTYLEHPNSRQISYPSNGYYTLGSAYNNYITEMGSYLIAEDTLSFGDGGVLKTSIDVDSYGYGN